LWTNVDQLKAQTDAFSLFLPASHVVPALNKGLQRPRARAPSNSAPGPLETPFFRTETNWLGKRTHPNINLGNTLNDWVDDRRDTGASGYRDPSKSRKAHPQGATEVGRL